MYIRTFCGQLQIGGKKWFLNLKLKNMIKKKNITTEDLMTKYHRFCSKHLFKCNKAIFCEFAGSGIICKRKIGAHWRWFAWVTKRIPLEAWGWELPEMLIGGIHGPIAILLC